MFQLLIPLIAAMTVSVSNWTGNPFESHAAEIKLQKAPVNIIIPDDVMTEFLAAPQAVKEKHCSANNDYPCLLYTSPSPRDMRRSRMPSSA